MDQRIIGRLLRDLRHEKKLTQEQLAEQLNVSARTVSRWETGSNMPDLSILVELADFYDVNLRELLEGKRKSEEPASEMTQTLEKIVEYTDAEKYQKSRATIFCTAIAFVLFLVIYVFDVFWLCRDVDGQDARFLTFFTGTISLLSIILTGTGLCVAFRRTEHIRISRCLLTSVFICIVILTATAAFLFAATPKAHPGKVNSVQLSFDESEQYTQTDLYLCADIVYETFREDYKGCRLLSLSYDEEFSKICNLSRSIYGNGSTKYDIIVLLSDWTTDRPMFHNDMTYEKWQWIFIRAEGGEWELKGQGYG